MRQLNEDIKRGSFRQIYLLYGEERYLRRQYREKLQKCLCEEGDTMNTHFYEGRNISVAEIVDLAETLPFFADRRVIFVTDSGLFKSGGEKLAEYLASPNESTYFVFTESEVDKRSRLYKAVQSRGYSAEFAVQDENTLKRWVAGILAREGKKIAESTVLLFLSKTGTDMENIQMELEKLVCYCGDRDIVTAQDVEAICTTRVSNHIFDMINAIAAGQQRRALELYYDLLALKEPPMRILFLMIRQYRILLQVKGLLKSGYGRKEIASKAGLHPFVAGKYMDQAKHFPTRELRAILEEGAVLEQSVKTGKLTDHLAVELFLVKYSS